MYFKENLRLLRKQKALSQDDLAKKLNYKSFTTIQKWEDGSSMPRMSKLQELASVLEIDLQKFLYKKLSVKKDKKRIPVLGVIRTGPTIYAEENIVDFEYVDSFEAVNGEYFYLEVIGDSMKDVRILAGDRVYIKSQSDVENGEIGVVLIDNEATLKRIFFENDKLILKSENEKYAPMVFSRKDIMDKNIQIIGKLIHNKIKF